jgi:hypothetical protein
MSDEDYARKRYLEIKTKISSSEIPKIITEILAGAGAADKNAASALFRKQ